MDYVSPHGGLCAGHVADACLCVYVFMSVICGSSIICGLLIKEFCDLLGLDIDTVIHHIGKVIAVHFTHISHYIKIHCPGFEIGGYC